MLLGPNGSGKTTLLKLVATTLLPDAGGILVAGRDSKLHGAAIRRITGFAFANERSFFPRLTARENLDFFAALDEVSRDCRASRIAELLNVVGLRDQGGTLVMKFSSGMYQRLGLARALLKRPWVLLLDEPTRSVDPASADQLRRIVRELRENGTTILLATHSFREAIALGDTVSIMSEGKICLSQSLRGLSAEELRRIYLAATKGVDSDVSSILNEEYEYAV